MTRQDPQRKHDILVVPDDGKPSTTTSPRGNYAQETVAPSVRSHYLAMLAREACHRQGEVVTWDEVVKSTTAFQLDTTGLKA